MDNLIVSVSPHIRAKDTTAGIMRDVLIALLPAVIASVLFFGWRALMVEVFCVAACVGLEWLFQWGMKRPVTVSDCSAAVTGLILALNLPVGIPLWMALVGCAVAILVVKQLFGGLGHNFANPAITARIVMFLAFSATMAAWVSPNLVDAVSSATPLAGLKQGALVGYTPLQLFLGAVPGCIGETSALALLLGGVYLLVRRVITWHTPVVFIATVFFVSLLYRGLDFAVAEILAGGLFLGAIFMATDYATTPSTPWGRVLFGLGCGLITVLIRFAGNYPEGVSFSILLMNILTPYLSQWTRSKPLGGETK